MSKWENEELKEEIEFLKTSNNIWKTRSKCVINDNARLTNHIQEYEAKNNALQANNIKLNEYKKKMNSMARYDIDRECKHSQCNEIE